MSKKNDKKRAAPADVDGGAMAGTTNKRSKIGGGTCGAAQQSLAAVLADANAASADPGDFPCFPAAVCNGRRFPWSIALQFAAARDLATLARTHRAARGVCRHEQTAKRVLKARHGRGCKRAKDTKCACGGCARVALLLRAADTLGECGDGPSRCRPWWTARRWRSDRGAQ